MIRPHQKLLRSCQGVAVSRVVNSNIDAVMSKGSLITSEAAAFSKVFVRASERWRVLFGGIRNDTLCTESDASYLGIFCIVALCILYLRRL